MAFCRASISATGYSNRSQAYNCLSLLQDRATPFVPLLSPLHEEQSLVIGQQAAVNCLPSETVRIAKTECVYSTIKEHLKGSQVPGSSF